MAASAYSRLYPLLYYVITADFGYKKTRLLRAFSRKLDGTGDLVGSDASCAYISSSNCTIVIDSDSLNVCIPLSSCVSVGMRNSVTGNLTFSANFTFS